MAIRRKTSWQDTRIALTEKGRALAAVLKAKKTKTQKAGK